MTPAPPRIGIVSLHYHASYAPRTLQVITKLRRDFQPVETVLVANTDQVYRQLEQNGSPWTLLRHDNRGMEFGGYQAGVDHLLGRHDIDWLFVLNDTVANADNYSNQYHEKFKTALGRVTDIPTVVGRVDAISRSYAMFGFRTHRWIRTNLFALNRSALSKLDSRIYDVEADRLVQQTEDPKKFFDPSLDPVLLDHLETFLFHMRPGWHWYAATPLTTDNASRMARKARSILQEKLLSGKLDHHAADFFNIKDMPLKQKTLRKLSDMRFNWTMKPR